MIATKIEELATKEYNVKIRNKKEVWYQRWIAKLLFFNKQYLDSFSSITLTEIHLSERATWRTICHELQHMVDMRKSLFIGFLLLYFSPQILALGSFFSLWFLLFLLPLPSLGRMWLEARAYGLSLAIVDWEHGVKLAEEDFLNYSKRTIAIEDSLEIYTSTMSGANYYFTMPIKLIARYMIKREYMRTLKLETKLHREIHEIITT